MNNKNINYLFIMRIWAAAILVACCYWLFSDIELEYGPKIYLPLIYFYSTKLYITKKMTVLLVPILMNIALWIPCYWSYIFIRLVLYAERIVALFWIAYYIVACIFGMIFMARGSIMDWIFISAIFMIFNEGLYRNFITDKYKEKFSATAKTEEEVVYLTSQLVVVFYVVILLFLMGEYVVQGSLSGKISAGYLPLETRNSIKLVKENEVEEIPYSDNRQTKLSRDEKMLLVKIPSYNEQDKEKNLFVINFASMETINILPSSNSTTKKLTDNDYEFTPDNKYVIVGNRVLDNSKIKFAVLDISTGKIDSRFHDPKGLLENLPHDVEEVHLIRFNPAGDYFVVISRVKYPEYRLELWDYKKGSLVYIEERKGYIAEFRWLSDKKCILFYDFYDKSIDKRTEFVEQREILEDGSVLAISKEDITTDIQQTTEEFYNSGRSSSSFLSGARNNMASDFTGKYLAINNKNIVKIWEVDTEKKIFSLDSDNTVLDIKFHPNGKEIIIFERLKNGENRITFWDIATNKKQRRIFALSDQRWNGDIRWNSKVRLVDGLSKIFFVTGAVNIISLEE